MPFSWSLYTVPVLLLHFYSFPLRPQPDHRNHGGVKRFLRRRHLWAPGGLWLLLTCSGGPCSPSDHWIWSCSWLWGLRLNSWRMFSTLDSRGDPVGLSTGPCLGDVEAFMKVRTQTPAVCAQPSFLPFLPDGELMTFVPWPSQSQLSVHRMICSVKVMLSGPPFHLHWQPEVHNSAPRGAKKVLHPDGTMQSDNRAVNPRESCAAFGLNYLLPEFWTERRTHETFLCGVFKNKRHAWNPGECCLWLIMTVRNLVKRMLQTPFSNGASPLALLGTVFHNEGEAAGVPTDEAIQLLNTHTLIMASSAAFPCLLVLGGESAFTQVSSNHGPRALQRNKKRRARLQAGGPSFVKWWCTLFDFSWRKKQHPLPFATLRIYRKRNISNINETPSKCKSSRASDSA